MVRKIDIVEVRVMNCDKSKDYCKLKIWAKSVIERDKVCKKCGKDYKDRKSVV